MSKFVKCQTCNSMTSTGICANCAADNMEFEKRCEMLKKLGVEFRQASEWRPKEPPRKPHPINTFQSFSLPFSPEEWCSVCMNDGNNYVGGCCGNMSVVQDILEHCFRLESGWLGSNDMFEIAQLFETHHDVEEGEEFGIGGYGKLIKSLDEEFEAALSFWKEADPWRKIAVIWHISKDFLAPSVPSAPGKHISPLESAIATLSDGMRFLRLERLFSENRTKTSQDQAQKVMILARVLPALKIVNEQIKSMDPGSINGFALVDLEIGNNEIASNRLGLCIYGTREEANQIMNMWRRDQAEKELSEQKPIDERIKIRSVRVSVDKGLEFLD